MSDLSTISRNGLKMSYISQRVIESTAYNYIYILYYHNTCMYFNYMYVSYTPHSPVVHTATVTKTHLLATTGSDPQGFVVRKVPSTYHCLNNGLFFICVLIANEDLTLATLMEQSVDLVGKDETMAMCCFYTSMLLI